MHRTLQTSTTMVRRFLPLLAAGMICMFFHATTLAQVNTWEKLFGNSGLDNGVALATLSMQNNDVIVVGSTQYSSAPDRWKLTVTRLDATGTIVWENTYPFSDDEYEIHPDFFDVVELQNYNIAFVANYRRLDQPNADWDVLIGVLDDAGSTVTPTFWTIKTAGKDELARGIFQTNLGQVIVVGTVWDQLSANSQSDVFAVNMNILTGTTNWSKVYGTEGREEAWDVTEYGIDAGLLLCGFADEAGGTGYTDPMLMTIERRTGTFVSATRQGKPNADGLFHEVERGGTVTMYACGLDCPNGTSELILASVWRGLDDHIPSATYYYNYAGITNGHHGGFHITYGHVPDHMVVTGFAQTSATEQDLLMMEVDRFTFLPTWVTTSPGLQPGTIDHGYAVERFISPTNERGYWVSGTSEHPNGFGSRDWYVLRTSGTGQTGCTSSTAYNMYSIDGYDPIDFEVDVFTSVDPIEMQHGALLLSTTICPIFTTSKDGGPAPAADVEAALQAGPLPVEQGQDFNLLLQNDIGNVDATVLVNDIGGRTRSELPVRLLQGEQRLNISTVDLEPGVYIIQVRTDAAVRTLKFIVR